MPNVTYPLDTTGISPSNLVRDEPHVLTEINDATYRIIIPDFAPFYQDNFQLKYSDGNGNITVLEKGVDFDFCLPYMDASRAIGKYLFGALTIHNEYIQGYLTVDYQTLGDKWVADKNFVLEALVSHNYNPRVVYWDQLTNVQDYFPPTSHAQDYDTIYGQKTVVESIDRIIEAILAGPNPGNQYLSHTLAKGNVHGLTLADLGLVESSNLPLALDEEVLNSDPVHKLFTLKQMLESGIIPREAGTAQIYVAIDDAITALTLQTQTNIETAKQEAISESVALSVPQAVAEAVPLAVEQAVAEAVPLAVSQAVSDVQVIIQQGGGLGGGGTTRPPEILDATQYYMSAMFG